MNYDLHASTLQYRAVWITEAGHATQGNLTTLECAVRQVVFLNKYRDAWLADEKGILTALLGHAVLLAVLGAGVVIWLDRNERKRDQAQIASSTITGT